MMKAHVAATIKGGGIVIRLPKSNHGFAIGYKDGGIFGISTNLFVSNGFEELNGLVELAYGETNVRDAGGEVVVVGIGSHVLLRMCCCGVNLNCEKNRFLCWCLHDDSLLFDSKQMVLEQY